MTDMTPHEQIAATIEREHAAWRALVDEVGRDRMDEPGPMGEWTFKDLAAHLLGWRERSIGRLGALGDGRPEPPDPWPDGMDDDDEINAWIHERMAARSADDVLAAVDASYGQLAAALGALPADVLTDPDRVPWLEGETALETDWLGHLHDEHEASIRTWLASRD
jgi:Mycothiol maleylpyruvate isomerase N-terminal domain